jgi:hypothetical protein
MEVLVELELLDKVATVAQETVHQRNLEVAVAALEMLGGYGIYNGNWCRRREDQLL